MDSFGCSECNVLMGQATRPFSTETDAWEWEVKLVVAGAEQPSAPANANGTQTEPSLERRARSAGGAADVTPFFKGGPVRAKPQGVLQKDVSILLQKVSKQGLESTIYFMSATISTSVTGRVFFHCTPNFEHCLICLIYFEPLPGSNKIDGPFSPYFNDIWLTSRFRHTK